MPKCTIDGKSVEFNPGENMIEAARRAGIEIPYFCYHPGLSIVGQCGVCMVEIEGMKKLQTACSTEPKEGMVIHTNSELAQKNQRGVMEFLLLNHPMDCPICDKSGECDLQDNSYKFGDAYQRATEERRTFVDLDMGPVIKKNMNRCIHCTRCIRFGEEVAGIREMVAVMRTNNVEISTVDGRPLETEYAGNYSDICPVGSLTLKDFRFKKRVWFLKKVPTVCEGCSKGCNMEAHQHANVVHRCMPRTNMEINKYWLCDDGRFNFHYAMDDQRIFAPAIRGEARGWAEAVALAKKELKDKKVVILVGSDLTQEEGKQLLEFLPRAFPGMPFYHFGTPGIVSSADDADADKILKRKSKTANLHGFEKLGFSGLRGLPANTDAVLVFRGGRAQLPDLHGKTVVGIGVFLKEEAEEFSVVLPGVSFLEKEGTVVNYQGVEQRFQKVINPLGESRQLNEIISLWEQQKEGGRLNHG